MSVLSGIRTFIVLSRPCSLLCLEDFEDIHSNVDTSPDEKEIFQKKGKGSTQSGRDTVLRLQCPYKFMCNAQSRAA
jgi:hypothetical protein